MTALNVLRFKGFELRPANDFDRELAEQWTAADPEHAGILAPEFWLEQRMGVDSVLVLDGMGPVFFCKVCLLEDPDERYAQVFVQFMPGEAEADRERIRTALAEGVKWLEPVLACQNVTHYFFDSRNETLIAFCVKRLGFEIAGGFFKNAPRGMRRMRKMLAVAS